MENAMNCTWGDKEWATDLLLTEKYLEGCYNSFLAECATPEVNRTLWQLLSDTHEMQQQLFEELNSRGWYPVTKAEDGKVTAAKQKFAAKVTK